MQRRKEQRRRYHCYLCRRQAGEDRAAEASALAQEQGKGEEVAEDEEEDKDAPVTGRWEVATYSRQGTANNDVELIVVVVPDKASSSTSYADGAVSEWASTLSFKVELEQSGAKAVAATIVPRFKPEHLKRRSGKNDLLEGMRAPHMAR